MKRHLLLFLLALVLSSLICSYREVQSKAFVKGVIWTFGGKRFVSVERTDEQGVPIMHYSFAGPQRNPLFIARRAIAHMEKYERTRNEKDRVAFTHCVDWLLENLTGDPAIYRYGYGFPNYRLPPKWRCGLAQGVSLVALERAARLTGDVRYLDLSRRVLNSFLVEIPNGGFTLKSPDSGWWYEEYASEAVEPPKVLNGMIGAVFSLHEYHKSTGSDLARYLFDQGVLALRTELPKYDRNGYSLYDQLGNPSGAYHTMHIAQLDSLYRITRIELFRDYADRWSEYYRRPFVLQLIVNPEFKRSVMFLGVFLTAFVGLEIAVSIYRRVPGVPGRSSRDSGQEGRDQGPAVAGRRPSRETN